MSYRPDSRSAAARRLSLVLTIQFALLQLLVPMEKPAFGQVDLERCIQMFESGEFQEADVLLRSLIEADPRNHTAVYYLGRTCLSRQEKKEAIEWLEKAVELNPGEVIYHKWLVKAYNARALEVGQIRALGLTRKIKRELETVIELDPTSWDEWISLIMLYNFLPKILGGDKERALELVGELRRIDSRDGALAMAELHIEKGDHDEAVQECNSYLATSPGDIRIRNQLGRAYHAMKRWEEAFGIYEEVIEEAPGDFHAYYLVGRSASVSGMNLDRGVECLRFFIDHTGGDEERLPSHADAHWRLGLIREQQGNVDAARAEYETALRIDPDHPYAGAAQKKLREK